MTAPDPACIFKRPASSHRGKTDTPPSATICDITAEIGSKLYEMNSENPYDVNSAVNK